MSVVEAFKKSLFANMPSSFYELPSHKLRLMYSVDIKHT